MTQKHTGNFDVIESKDNSGYLWILVDDLKNFFCQTRSAFVAKKIAMSYNAHDDLVAALGSAIKTVEAAAIAFEADGYHGAAKLWRDANLEYIETLAKAKEQQ